MHLAFTLLGLATVCKAINLSQQDVPAVVHAPIQRHPITSRVDHDKLRRRAGTISETLSNQVTLYLANITLGTPAQSLALHIDTGSSDLWVNTANSTLCKQYPRQCALFGTYSQSASSTYAYVNNYFNISYEDGSGAAGIYATDTVHIGGASLANAQFGIGYTSSSAEGILGIGYTTNEAQIAYNDQTYSNVPALMYKNGLINSNAYSLWLDDLNANTGSILFGGVDTSKYTGTLETIPIIPTYGIYSQFIVGLTGIGLNGVSGSVVSNQDIGVLLDSGTSLLYLPDDIATPLITHFGGVYQSSLGAATIDCSVAKQTGSVTFTFTSQSITVPISELVIVDGVQNGKEICIFGIAPSGSSLAILGDTFLRSAYVVYDLSNNEISLAQTNFNPTAANILEITNSATGVPNASVVANAATTVATSAATGVGNNVISTIASTIASTSTAGASKAVATPPPSVAMGALAVAGLGAVFMY